MVLLLPKLRRYFAEFLDHSSLDRLGILYLTTCVGLGYGPQHSLEAFLDSMGSPYFATNGYASPLTRHNARPDLPGQRATRAYTRTTNAGGTTLLRHPIACLLPAGSHAPPSTTPKATPEVRMVSITGFATDAPTRAREYQPVVHRLRLSASP